MKARLGWRVDKFPHSFHVVPVADLHPHNTTGACICACGPRVDRVDQEDGTPLRVPLVLHNAYDCREAVEEARAILEF